MTAQADFRAPGLLGGLMLFGGRAWWLWLLAGYLVAVRLLWGLLSRLSSAPVALSLLSLQCLYQSMEGGFQAQNVLSMLMTALAVEFVKRRFFGTDGPLSPPRGSTVSVHPHAEGPSPRARRSPPEGAAR